MTLLFFSLWIGLIELRSWFDGFARQAGLAITLLGYVIYIFTVRW